MITERSRGGAFSLSAGISTTLDGRDYYCNEMLSVRTGRDLSIRRH